MKIAVTNNFSINTKRIALVYPLRGWIQPGALVNYSYTILYAQKLGFMVKRERGTGNS